MNLAHRFYKNLLIGTDQELHRNPKSYGQNKLAQANANGPYFVSLLEVPTESTAGAFNLRHPSVNLPTITMKEHGCTTMTMTTQPILKEPKASGICGNYLPTTTRYR